MSTPRQPVVVQWHQNSNGRSCSRLLASRRYLSRVGRLQRLFEGMVQALPVKARVCR